MMEYRQLGSSGLRVSKLCLGTMRGFVPDNQDMVTRVVGEAVDLGINFIDMADCYRGSEEATGKAVADLKIRDKVVLATKFGWYMGRGANDYGTSRYHIVKSCENSLRRLGTDRIDLYILHVVDPNTPWEEVLSALDVLIRQGKVLYIGTSKYPATLILESLAVSEKRGLPRFVSEQPPYNLLDRTAENELIPACMRHGIGITPFQPMAHGFLTGRITRDRISKDGMLGSRKLDHDELFTSGALRVAEQFSQLAGEKGVTPAELNLAWITQQPGVTAAILGCRSVEHLHSAVKGCDMKLSREDMDRIDEISPPGSHVSNYFEINVARQFRMHYSSAARKVGYKTGAYIPDHKTGSEMER